MDGYKVFEAENGRQALSILESGTLPQLIFLDLMMPVMDGIQFYQELRKNSAWADIVAVILSATGNLQEKLAALGEPAPPTLKKPVDLDVIVEITQKYCSA